MSTLGKKHQKYANIISNDDSHFLSEDVIMSKMLQPGIYTVNQTQSGQIYFTDVEIKTDHLVDLPESVSQSVVDDIKNFWLPKTKEKFDKMGFLYKRGVLMHGVPGGGKSVTVFKIISTIIKDGGIVLMGPNSKLAAMAINGLRQLQPDLPVLIVYEELDEVLQYDGGILSFLDGDNNVDNVVVLATTNYIERIPPRIKNRPSRFAKVIEVGMPSLQMRRAFLSAKLQFETPEAVDSMAEKSHGFSVDHLKDLIVSVYCLDLSLEEAIKNIQGMAGIRADKEDNSRDWTSFSLADFNQVEQNDLKASPSSYFQRNTQNILAEEATEGSDEKKSW